MPVDAEQWRAEIGNFNGCLHYAVIKLKLNLSHIMTSVSQVLVFLLAILLQWISKDSTASCFLSFFVFVMSPVVSELTLHAVCLCFEFRHLTKQIPTLQNIINLVNVLSIGYFIHLFLLLLQHGDMESNPGPNRKQVNNLSCCHWNVNSLMAQNLSKISQIEAYNSLCSHDFICISETYFGSTILEGDKSFHLNGYNLLREDHPNNTK